MMRPKQTLAWGHIALALIAATTLWRCGGSEPAVDDCGVEGATLPCECPDGTAAAQTCLADGAWGACACTDGDTGADADVGSDADTGDGDVDHVDAADGDTAVVNACGGDGPLDYEGAEAAPGDACGVCGEGVLYCMGGEALACSDEGVPNACGGCEPLPYEPGDACGSCASWACGDGQLVCDGSDCNACGGREVLDASPGYQCEDDAGRSGHWRCRGLDEVFCHTDATNACGGETELDDLPGAPCGVCDLGVLACDGTDATVCDDEDRGVNACGGCAALQGQPGEACGRCGGQWACDGTNDVVCDDDVVNACGGCEALEHDPGAACGDGLYFCANTEETLCGAADVNLCGGDDALETDPGEPCGVCGGGVTVCATLDHTVCAGQAPVNECGGCAVLPGTEGAPCGPRMLWRCDESGDMRCVSDQINACGGEDALSDVPGNPCGACGVIACAGTNSVACVGDVTNVCGGCAPLDGAPGDTCGECSLGVLACASSGEALSCDDPNPVPTWWQDNDGDGFGDATQPSVSQCVQPALHASRPGDCNDNNAGINPDADEQVGDDADSNCDGEELCWEDLDSDGWRASDAGVVLSANASCGDGGEASNADPIGDCDDTNRDANPDALEVCDYADNDCDGGVDEERTNACGGCVDFAPAAGPGDGCGPGRTYVCDGGDAVTCVVTDPCAAETHDCDDHATCTPTAAEPGYICTCDVGYSGDGASCYACSDGIRNGDEEGVDCGGSCAGPCAEYAYVADQRFAMGAAVGEAHAEADELPAHRVGVGRGLWVQTTEVTQAQWRAVMGDNPSAATDCGDACPVEQVSWYAALAYANALSTVEGRDTCYDLSGCVGEPGSGDYRCATATLVGLECDGYRLPTEAEWELVARDGTDTATYYGDPTIATCTSADPILEDIAWYCANADGAPHPVGAKSATLAGVGDLLGNVAEWTWDAYADDAYDGSADVDPIWTTGATRVLRGGSYLDAPPLLRAASRDMLAPATRSRAVGFRVVRSQPCAEGTHGPSCELSCSDGVLNGAEVDRDCGNPACPGCTTGQLCTAADECLAGGSCPSGTCAFCDDGVLNGDETDIDCGGDLCAGCASGGACEAVGDCAEGGYCVGLVCAFCDDGVHNGNETDVDCGGPECGACALGQACDATTDCAIGECATGVGCVVRQRLVAPDRSNDDYFGYSVDVDGRYAVLGAIGDDDGASRAGSAYIFRWSGTTWVYQTKLNASDPHANANFGYSVAMSGDRVAIGAYSANSEDGAVYVFHRSGSAWSEEAMFPGEAGSGERLGIAVDLDATTLVVGASNADSAGVVDSGAAYVFTLEDTGWTQQAVLSALGGAAGDAFGRAITVSGDTLVASAHGDDAFGDAAGSVHVFVRGESSWSHATELYASDAQAGSSFGLGLDLDGDRLVVGAPGYDAPAENAGRAYVFDRVGVDWGETSVLVAGDAGEGDQFGRSVAVQGDRALVGAYLWDDSYEDVGAAYVFDLDSEWRQTQRLEYTPSSERRQTFRFGFDVALSDAVGVVSAYNGAPPGWVKQGTVVFHTWGTP